jgi:iron(III) transport system substrate-binding protein
MTRSKFSVAIAGLAALSLANAVPFGARTASAQVSSTEWATVERAAEQQGRVVLYISIAGLDPRIKAAFQKAYPKIQLNVIRQPTGELISRLDAERQANADGADVVFHTDRGWFKQVAGHLVSPRGPAMTLYAGTKSSYDDKYVTGMLIPFSLAYNTEVLKTLGVSTPTGWKDMLNPKFGNGLIAMPERGSAPVTLQCWHAIAEMHGKSFFEQLGKSRPRLHPSIGPTVQAVAAGAAAVGFVQTAAPADLIKAGAPIKQVVPADPGCAYGYFLAQVSWSKRPEAAQVLLNWMMSREGQTAIHGWGYSASPLEKIPGSLEVNADKPLLDGILTPEQQQFGRDVDAMLRG